MSVEWIGDLAQARPALEALADGRDPFMDFDWLEAWRAAFAPESEPRIAVLSRDGEPAGVLPLLEREGGLAAMANDHTPSFRPLARDDDALRELVDAAIAPVLAVPMVPEGHPLLGLRGVTSTDAVISPRVDMAATFDEWRELTKPRWQTPIERLRRKMDREHEAVFSLVEAPQDLDATLTAGFDVEGSGWKAAAGTAISSQPQTEAFYRAVARAFEARGELRCSSITLDGRMVAFGLQVLHGGRLYQLKTGFDESLRKLAPGLVLQLGVIERCFELELDAYEFLGHTSEWKRKFATGERAYRTWTGYRSGTRYAYRRARRLAGRLLARQRA